MEDELQALRDEIPSYNDIQAKLHNYLINKSLGRLVISSEEFLKSIEYG